MTPPMIPHEFDEWTKALVASCCSYCESEFGNCKFLSVYQCPVLKWSYDEDEWERK